MDCHQILSGACNAGDRCFAIGSVEGIPFTAYAAGCNIVILASTFERVQIIPGATHNYIRISALDCSTDTGKIAAAYEDKVCIFEPTPLIHSDTPPPHGLEYRWVQTGTIHTKSHISSLSWNLEGTRLLTGGVTIQMWHGRITHKEDDEPTGVKFEIGGDRDPKTPTNEEDTETWDCVWKCHTATPVHHMAFSPDGTLFATSGKSDRLIKVWYENKQLLFPNKSMDNTQYSSMNSTDHNHPNMELSYGFVYIAHPRAVTHISWRKTSKYMPKGSVSNMLVTSCLDNICRIWIETVLPDDGLVNMNQFDPLATQNPKFRTHRQKHRFMQRLKHMKTCFHIRRHAKHHAGAAGMHGLGAAFGGPGAGTNFGHSPIPSLPSTYSVHDFHSYGYHGTGVTPGLHFHLAASINAETDIPLVPSMQTNDPSNQPNFILHWLNNKEMHFSLQAEAILQDLTRKVIEKEHLQNLLSSGGAVICSDHASETGHEVNEDNIIGSENDKKTIKLNKSMKNSSSHEDSNSDDHMAQYSNKSVGGGIGGMSGSQQTMTNHHSMSNTTSINSLATEHGVTGTGTNIGGPGGAGGNGYHIADSLDMKIECLLRDWHHSPDLLFSIHPIDGSYLIWVVEWLDEYHPGAFRQAQVSFSTRIPSGFPLGDAMSMSTTVSLYNTGGNLLHFKEMVKGVKPSNVNSNGTGAAGGDPNDILTPLPSVLEESENEWPTQPENNEGGNINNINNNENLINQQTNENNNNINNGANSINESLSTKNASDQISTSDLLSAPPSPTISMVTKHSNGTLNLWQLTFADKTKFTQVLSIGHVSRASGHRFRVNDITCHPVLPLLLTTSHHNIPEIPTASAPVPGRLNSNLNVNANINNSHNTNSIDRRNRGKDICVPSGFCSELILWRVDAVGPLSQSGGVSELARINSLEISAFSNVAWIPTLLPSTTLGSLSNSSSACFVASDGESLRIYQAVIDARTLLAEISSSERRARRMDSMLSLSTEYSSDTDYHHNQHQSPLHNKIKIVSQQSTARPGCIIQLDAITDATHDWQNTQFLHVFQEQLITGERIEIKPQIIFTGDISGSMGPGTNGIDNVTGINGDIGLTEQQMGAIVDLQRNADFEEPFYIALLERTSNGSTMHMWRIVIASQPPDLLSESVMYVPDSNIVQDLDDPEPGPRQSVAGLHSTTSNNTLFDAQQQQQQQENDVPHIRITTTKVCTQELPLPDGVDVVHAAPAAGHLSSSSIYPACFAPYIIVTACSDSTSRFWKCKIIKSTEDPDNQQLYRYEWCEWDMLSKDYVSNIEINGQPLHISAAYSGRIACAYKYGKSFTRPNNKGGDPDSRYVNLSVAIYECESTGGSEWILEDTIHLKNVHLPRLHLDPHLDLSYLHDNRYLQKKQRLTQVLQTFTTQHDENRSRNGVGGSTGSGSGIGGSSGGGLGGVGGVGVNGGHVSGDVTPDGLTKTSNLLAVPSFSTLQSLRKSITDHGNTCPLTQKHLVQLDWVSKEDGSHILTVAVGSKILLYTPVSSDLAQANIKAMKESQSTNRPILRKASSLAQPHFNDEIRWMKLRQIELNTADGLPPLPMQMSWVRDGILVVGMDSEMHVYSQWKSNRKNISNNNVDIDDLYDTRNLRDEDLRSMANENSQRRLANVTSMPHLSRVSSMNLQMLEKKKKAAAAAALAAASSSSSGTGLTGAITAAGVTTNIAAVTVTTDYMPDYGLFEASRIACPVLPQYHPKQLMELLNSGKIRWVKAILAHLVRCISGTYGRGISGGVGGVGNSGSGGGDEESLNRQRGWSRSRTLSVSYVAGTTSPLEPRGSTTQMPEELTLDYAEITSIPPLPLWTLLDADKEMSGGAAQQQTDDAREYVDLFDANVNDVNDDDLDELLDGDDTDTHQRFDRRQSVPERQSLSHFGPRQGQLLSRLLTHTHLPGLSSLDQMHLLALADTVATCNIDFAERFANDAARTAMAKENLTGVPDAEAMSTESLDDCGLRFLLAMKHFTYLLRCLPLAQRTQFQKQGVGTSNIVWAFHSESEEDVLNLIPSYGKGQIKWQTVKELGAGWWLRNNGLLRLCIEKLAKAAYQAKQDPMDAAIYYIAMKKKSLVWGLYRTKRDEKMTAFFANDFSDDRWRKAALKNAFALLGKQRFEHAVAFFLLANSLNDAIEVCLTKLEDLQLALIIARLFESDHDATPPTYKKLLYENILGCDSDGDNQCLENAHPDPFLRSMALWILKDYSGSLNTLLLNNVGHNHPDYVLPDPLLKSVSNQATNPNVFNFYIYLRTHPLLIRQYIASTAQEKKKTQVVLSGFSYSGGDGPPISINSKKGRTDKQIQIEDSITPLERQLYFTTAHGHFKAGCPALALEVLSKLPTKVIEESTSQLVSPNDGKHNQQIESGILDWNDNSKIMNGLDTNDNTTNNNGINGITNDWSAPVSNSFDWSQPVTKNNDDDGFKIEWDDDKNDDDDDNDDDIGIGMNIDKKKNVDNIETVPPIQVDTNNNTQRTETLDIMAQQLKFVACLKILMEELSTLATGFEVDGGQLRYQLYVWLEKEVEALRQLCNYSSADPDSSMDDNNVHDTIQNDTAIPTNFRSFEKPTLHEILMQEKFDFEAKVQRAARRKRWLKANETLLRTLLSYCSLHGASGGGLASVRMELVLLLQELQQEKTQQQLLSPLPFPTTLPLLSACVAGNKTVTADPIKYLQSHTQDMLQTIVDLRQPPIGLKVSSASEIFVLRDLAVALSACIYQSLCDSDTFIVKQVSDLSGFHSPGMETLARLNASCQSSHLMANAGAHQRRRKYSSDEPVTVSTSPSKWPGVTNLRALLAREKDEDIPRLNVLLCEAFMATFMSLLVYALATCDCHILYRLAGQKFSSVSWSNLFGGGIKKLLRKATSQLQTMSQPQTSQSNDNYQIDTPESPMTATPASATDTNKVWTAVTSLTKQRVKLNMKLLGHFSNPTGSPNMKEDKPTYREQFVSPDMSMVSYFLIKPTVYNHDPDGDEYDSADSISSDIDDDNDEEDVFADPLNNDPKINQASAAIKKHRMENTEHSNPNSYSWVIMRLAVMRIAQLQLQEFISVAGIEHQELPVASPLIHGVIRSLTLWQDIVKEELSIRGPAPPDFIPGCFVESDAKGPAIHKYRSILEKHNTPFSPIKGSAAPAIRLWNYLVRQDAAQEIFIRAIFGKKRSPTITNATIETSSIAPSVSGGGGIGGGSSLGDILTPSGGGGGGGVGGGGGTSDGYSQSNQNINLPEPVRIIHKEQESISAFCLNLVNPGLLALATPREAQEMDIALLLESPQWLEDECELDILNLNKDIDTLPASGFLLIQATPDKNTMHQSSHTAQSYTLPASPQQGIAGQSGRGASVVLKHKVDNIKRMCAHPLMPLYLTGGQDGSVQLWEWGHQQVVCTPRPPGTFAKVTRCRFSQHGNKFGIADGDGNLSLWQAGLATQCNRSFFTFQCHNKGITDFVFLGSCSLVASAGHSSENKNVCIWDTLLPQKKSLVVAFTCHDQGASSLVYAPQHQLLISAGKKGDICIFDVRQRKLRHRFQAHENPIKCLAIDPHEEHFVTGSADGDIKVWGLTVHTSLYSFPGEHARNSFFKHIGQGVTQLQVDANGRLFSCGADGSMKVRQLPDRESIIHSFY